MSTRVRVVLLLLFVVLGLGVGTRTVVSTSLTDALPADGELGAAFHDVERFSLLDTLWFEIDGTGHGPDELHAAIDALGARLQARDDFAAVRWRFGLADGIAIQKAAAPSLAVLTPLPTLQARLSPDGMQAALAMAAAQMAGPTGALVAARLQGDPLDLGGSFTEGALRQGAGAGVKLVNGHLIAADGVHGLLYARAKTPALGTSLESPIVVHIQEDLAASALPADWLGSHRFAAEAQAMIKDEVNVAVSAGVGLVLVVFLVAFRSLRPLLGTIPATIVGSASAAAAAALASPVHGIALAFGGALAGMGVDYWIHLYLTGIKDGVPATFRERLDVGRHALAHLLPAYRISVAATVTSFLMLATSSYPVVSDIGMIGIGVAVGALLSVVLAGPLVFAALARPGDRLPRVPLPDRVPGWFAGVLVLVLAVLATYATGVEFDGDPRAMDARAPATAALETRFEERYGGDATTGLVVADGATLDDALEALRPAVDALAAAPGVTVQSPLGLLPSPSQRAARVALTADPTLDSRFSQAADAAGFDAGVLLPAFRGTLSATATPTPATWAGTPAEDLLGRTVQGTAVAAIVSGVTQEALDHARHEVEWSGAKVRFIHPAAVAADGATRIRTELVTRSGFALGAVLLYMVLRYRDVPRFLGAAMPSLAAVAGTLGTLSYFDIPLTPVSGPAFVLILGVAFDQGIFLVEAEDTASTEFRAARSAIVVALTTALAGFVGLLSAHHPAVWSVGAVVSLGIAWTAVGAFFIVPAILTPDGSAATRRWFRRLLLGATLGLSADALVSVLGRVEPPPSLPVGPTQGRMARVDGLTTYYLHGNASQIGHDVAVLTGEDRMAAMEEQADGELRKHVPLRIARYALLRTVPLFAPRIASTVPESMLQEIAASAGVGDEDPLGYIAPRYTRKVCLHALHDIGQAMVDAPWVQGCTGFVAGGEKTPDGHWLLGRNWDFDGGRFFDEDKAVLAVRRDGAIPFVHVAIPDLAGAVSGLNDAQIGVAVFAAASDAHLRLTTPMIFLVREILESATSLDDARRILERGRGFVSENVLVVDGKRGRAAVFEVTPDDVTELDAGTGRVVANHFHGPHAGDRMNQERMAEGTTVSRETRMQALFDAGPVDVPRAIAMLTDDGGLPKGHEGAINARNTSHSVILDATAKVLYVSRYPNLDGGYERFALDDLLHGNLVGTRVSDPVDPVAAFQVHEVRDLVRRSADDPVVMERALRLNPHDPDATLALARDRAAAGDLEGAATLARELLALPPERASQARAARVLADLGRSP